MATSTSQAQIESTTPTRMPAVVAFIAVGALSRVAVVLSIAGGVIHLAVVRHHIEYPAIAVGFTVMAGAQLLVAAGLFTRPSARMRMAGVLLHTSIVSTWLLSRAVGLAVVPGAEDRAALGVADTVANTFAVGVVAALVAVTRVEQRHLLPALPARAAGRIVAVVTVAAVALTATAVLAPHEHAGHDHPAAEEPGPGPGQDHGPVVDGHDDHAHDHG